MGIDLNDLGGDIDLSDLDLENMDLDGILDGGGGGGGIMDSILDSLLGGFDPIGYVTSMFWGWVMPFFSLDTYIAMIPASL